MMLTSSPWVMMSHLVIVFSKYKFLFSSFSNCWKLQQCWMRETCNWYLKLWLSRYPHGHVIIQVVVNCTGLTTTTTTYNSCRAPYHMTSICELVCCLVTSKVSGEASGRLQVALVNRSCCCHFIFHKIPGCLGECGLWVAGQLPTQPHSHYIAESTHVSSCTHCTVPLPPLPSHTYTIL